MTDGEKAEKSLEKRKGEYWCIKTDNVYIPYTEGYKDGLAEGRKIQCGEQGKDGMLKPCEVMKENAELKKDKEYLDKINNEQTEVILHLNEQIEKMKCCENCKHHSFWGDELKCNFFDYDEEMKCHDDKHGWELAK